MERPLKPDDSDCCNSGCNPCILDVYQEQLRKYEKKLLQLTTSSNCISPTSYTIFRLINLERQSQHAFLFTFEFDRPLKGKFGTDISLFYKPGQHFLLKGKTDTEEFTRAYTPIPVENRYKLQFTTLVKLYGHGKMSNYFKQLSIGSETLWRGPYGDFEINFNIKYLLFIAQGTGVAPIYSIIYDVIQNEDCYTFLKLFFCCASCDDIYLREQLYELSKNWNFTYEVFLSKSENVSAKYSEVIHNKKLELEDIRSYLDEKCGNVNVVVCGSENFMQDIKKHTLKCKIKEEDVLTL